jgi:uncharacterized protein
LILLGAVRGHPFRTLLLALLSGFALSYLFGTLACRPMHAEVPRLAANEIRFALTASDGIKTAASYFPAFKAGAPGVLLFHGVGASRSQFEDHVKWLNRVGYAVLTIDFRGHGESDQEQRSFGLFEARDARAAFDWLKAKQGGAPIGAIGVSLGGAAALMGEKGPLPVDALILQAVYPDIRRAISNRIAFYTPSLIAALGEPILSYQSILRYGVWPDRLSPIAAAKHYDGPALVIGGTADRYTPAAETRALAAAFPRAPELWFAQGLGHGQVSSLDSAEYQHHVLTFLDQHLKSR